CPTNAASERRFIEEIELIERLLIADHAKFRDGQRSPRLEVREQLGNGPQLPDKIQKIVHGEIRNRRALALEWQLLGLAPEVNWLKHLDDYDAVNDPRKTLRELDTSATRMFCPNRFAGRCS